MTNVQAACMAAQHHRSDDCRCSHRLHTCRPISPVFNQKFDVLSLDAVEIYMMANPDENADAPNGKQGQGVQLDRFYERMEGKYKDYKDAHEEDDTAEKDPITGGRSGSRLPSLEAQWQHNKSHIPYRSWCKYCVMVRAQHFPHTPLR